MQWDLGVRDLVPEWKKLFAKKHLRADLVAGLTVACVAIPLSLAISIASEVPPSAGIMSAIVAGIVVALFGGTPLAVSGPAAAMAVLVATIVEQHGLRGLIWVGIGSGLMQLVAGMTKLGRFARFVPVPVVHGFIAGIGAIILIGQLPRALGLPPPDQSHVFDVISHLREEINGTHPVALALAVASLAICLLGPKISAKLPSPLLAVVVTTAATVLLHLDVETVGSMGAMPRGIPLPGLPGVPVTSEIAALATAAVMVFALGSLETLLSSSAVDKLAAGPPHDPNQELIGQGLGNVASALFGGIPVTGVIARSALNVAAGGKTRRAAIVHSIAVAIMVFAMAPIIGRIPLAALAGILFSVAVRMLDVHEFLQLWKTSRAEAGVYLLTFAVIVLGDLIAGVQAGLIAAFLVAAVRLGQTRVRYHRSSSSSGHISVSGPMTFLSTTALDPIRKALDSGAGNQDLVLDLTQVSSLDVSGAEMLGTLVERLEAQGNRVALVGLRQSLVPILRGGDTAGRAMANVTLSSRPFDGRGSERPIDRLVRGVVQFQHDERERYAALFAQLAEGQTPHTLFITCADSRIVPNLITSTDPGELFIIRNVGNIVPPSGSDVLPSEGAAIEFAVGVLGVTEIIVCGHSQCGAMKAVLDPNPTGMTSVDKWLEPSRSIRFIGMDPTPEGAAQLNALMQLQNVLSYPIVRERVSDGRIRLDAWYYDLRANELRGWNEERGGFVSLAADAGDDGGVRSSEQRTPPGSEPPRH